MQRDWYIPWCMAVAGFLPAVCYGPLDRSFTGSLVVGAFFVGLFGLSWFLTIIRWR